MPPRSKASPKAAVMKSVMKVAAPVKKSGMKAAAKGKPAMKTSVMKRSAMKVSKPKICRAGNAGCDSSEGSDEESEGEESSEGLPDLKNRPVELVSVAGAARGDSGADLSTLEFYVRKSVKTDVKGRSHGDKYILKKMFSDRAYQRAWNRNNPEQKGEMFKNHNAVLDLGANIGCFAAEAALAGVKHVTAYEPDKETHRLLEWNLARVREGGAQLHALTQAVAFGGGAKYLYAKAGVLARNKQKQAQLKHHLPNPNRSSLIKDSVNNLKRAGCVGVSDFGESLECRKRRGPSRPSILVKCDIEGAELECVLKSLVRRYPTREAFRERTGVKTMLVYYHLDKHPKLKNFDKFLTALEFFFPKVAPESCPMLEKGFDKDSLGPRGWRTLCRQDKHLEGTTEGLGMASAKKDVLVYCGQ